MGQCFSCTAPPFNAPPPSLWLPLASRVLVPWQLRSGLSHKDRRHVTCTQVGLRGARPSLAKNKRGGAHTPKEKRPHYSVVGTGQPDACRAHQEVRSSQTLLPELREEEEEEEESVLLSLPFLFGPLLLPLLLLLLLVDVSRRRCRDRLRLVTARLEGIQPRRRGDLRWQPRLSSLDDRLRRRRRRRRLGDSNSSGYSSR